MRTKLLDYSIYLLLAVIPIQLGYHFWPATAFISGQRIDYLAPTVFALDLLCLFILTLGVSFSKNALFGLRRDKVTIVLLTFVVVSAVSAVFAFSPLSAWVSVARLFELVGICLVLRTRWSYLSLKKVVVAIAIGAAVTAVLALGQFYRQGSFNLRFIGERSFSANTYQIAKAPIGGELLLRSYASFPHPNVLAAYLSLGSAVLMWVLLKNAPKIGWHRLGLAATLCLALAALLSTFSRSAITVTALSCLLLIAARFRKSKKGTLLIGAFALLVVGFFGLGVASAREDESVTRRLLYSDIGLQIIKRNWLLGVGPSSFIPYTANHYADQLPVLERTSYLQPIHNLWLLVAVENGIFAVLLLLLITVWALRNAIRHRNYLASVLILQIALLSLVDHYFWTLIQGQLLFWLTVSFALKKDTKIL